jgi:hypothetical protein
LLSGEQTVRPGNEAPLNSLVKSQLENNQGSRNCWDAFADHRKRVMALLHKKSPRDRARICIFGAGNCNDLDLASLLAAYDEIHLVDLDKYALGEGVARQGFMNATAFRLHEVDLTASLGVMAQWSPLAAIGDTEVAACAERPVQSVTGKLPGPFEIVASTCVLSQLMEVVTQSVGVAHPRFLELVQAVRIGHLRLLMNLVAPGGAGVLISDIVSSDTVATLGAISEGELPGALVELLQARNFFHGVNPAIVTPLFKTDPILSPQITELQVAWPWRWNCGSRLYLVYAIKAWKSASAKIK